MIVLYRGNRTFPISVTLTALNKDPVSSSRTATLLTPSSLINFIASRTVDFEVEATTEEEIWREGNAKLWRESDKNDSNEGVSSAYEANHDSNPRSETIPA